MNKLRRLPRKFWVFLSELNILGWILLLCLLGTIGFTANWTWHYFHARTDEQVIIDKVKKLAVLPDERPVVAKVEDASQVNQPFLQNAENGDETLIFPKARKVILYRPKTNQIVNMGPLLTTLVPVFVRKGAPNADINSILDKIKSQSVNFTVASTDETPQSTYDKTIVVDLTGARSSAAEQLAQLLHASVAAMPKGESRPDADLLVIVGAQ